MKNYEIGYILDMHYHISHVKANSAEEAIEKLDQRIHEAGLAAFEYTFTGCHEVKEVRA